MPESLRILMLEDNPVDADLIQYELKEAGFLFTPRVVKTKEDFAHELETFSPDLILSDYDLPQYNGALALAEAQKTCPEVPFILVSGAVTEDLAIEILTQGAKDYVLKNRLEQRLVSAVTRALSEAEEHRARRQAEEELLEAHRTLEEKVKIRTAELEDEIATRRMMEEALRESEERYRSLFENAPVGIFYSTADGKIIRVNAEFARVMGYGSPEEIKEAVNRSTLEQVLYEKPPERANLVRNAQETTGWVKSERRYRRKDGSLTDANLAFRSLPENPNLLEGFVEDITERKRSEEALRESETKLQAIFDSVGAGIVIVDSETKTIVEANQTAMAMTGLPREKMIGQICHALVCPALEGKCPVKDLGQQIDHAERKLLCVDGKRMDILKTVHPIRIKGRECYVESFIDISDRLQAEALRKEDEGRFHQLFDNMTEGAAIYQAVGDGEDFIFVDLNETGQRLSATTRDEAIGRQVTEVFPGVEEMGLLEVLRQVWRTGAAQRHPTSLYKDERIVHWVENYVFKLPSGVIVALYTDTTEKRRAEEALRESEERWQFALEGTGDGIWDWDLATGHVYYSPQWKTMLGYDDAEIGDTLGEWDRLLHPDDRAVAYASLDRHFRHETAIYQNEHRLRCQDGSYKWVLDRGKVIDWTDDGRPKRAIGVHSDISRRKQLEEERRELEERLSRAEKMEALGTLAGGVAHDLNNVLGVVIAFSELLADKVDESDPLRSYVKHIMDNSERAASIVEDLLTMARRGVHTEKVFNLNEVIAEYERTPEHQRMQMLHPQIRIRTELEAGLLNVKGSPVHLEKTIMNLVLNAAEAIAGPGTITIRTQNVYLDRPVGGYDHVQEGDYVVLSVSDTGEGIGSDHLKRIFEPFYTKKVMGKSGTGLGLSVVWGTVKDHRGYIDVETELGEGTIFTLYFPVTREEISGKQAAVPLAAYLGRGESVLVVDDVEGQREVALALLGTLNYRVTAVASGEAALAYLRDHEADIMVLDMIMDPGIDGLETYRRVLEIRPGQKAVIVSGFSESDRVHAAHALGAGAYVRKPYVMDKLGLAVRGELDRTS